MPSSPPAPGREQTSLIEQCADLCEQCIAQLDVPDSLYDDESVHALRVSTKRLRAAWHLVKAVDRQSAKNRRSALSELSAAVAGRRDHDVLLGLATELAAECDSSDAFAPLIETLSQDPDEGTKSSLSPDALRGVWIAELAVWRSLDSALCEPARRRKVFREALRKSERRAAQLTRKALANPKADNELWHDWRKAVKRLRYQREFIAESQGRQLGIRDGRISRLGTRLGERNDLANLIEAVEDLPDLTKRQHGQIRKAIALRERRVLGSARRLARLAFLR